MKRIVTLLLAAGLVMGAYTGAQAADIKVSGQWNFGFNFVDTGYSKDSESDFSATQRLRTQIDVIASENLKGVVYFEIGDQHWGNTDEGGALSADKCVVEVRRSYIDWTAPNSDLKIRMGIQGLALPGAAFGSPLFDEDVAALTMSYAFSDEFALTAFWARPFDGGSENDANGDDEMDMFGLVAPISLDGHSISPYVVYSQIGKDVTFGANGSSNLTGVGEATAYWFGVAYTMSAFDPFTLDVDFIYGDLDSDVAGVDQSGWLIDVKAAYALDFMTPALLGWYASADKDDKSMPVVGNSDAWAPTSFGFGGSCFEYDSNLTSKGAQGTWGLGIELADISFVEDLSHVVRVVYLEAHEDGANTDSAFLLNQDGESAVEFNLDSTYQIYENFKFILELGYIDLDLKGTDTEAATKATFNFIYSF